MKIDKYCKLSHQFGQKYALERCIFEISMRQKVLKNDSYEFEDFKKDLYSSFVYSKRELKKIYNKVCNKYNYCAKKRISA